VFYDVGVLRTVTATRYIRVEANSQEEAEEKAVEQAGDEDWNGCVTECDFDVTAIVEATDQDTSRIREEADGKEASLPFDMMQPKPSDEIGP
jgi:hypothetical protein